MGERGRIDREAMPRAVDYLVTLGYSSEQAYTIFFDRDVLPRS